MERIRPPAVAGSFYPSAAQELSRLIEECLVQSPLGPRGAESCSPSLIAALVPHAGYVYSGACAAHLFARLDASVRRVIVLGVNHHGRGERAALSPAELWQTPLGPVCLDQELTDLLESRLHFLKRDELAHAREHSIEVQLPFLQHMLGEFMLTPVSLSHVTLEECAELGAAVAAAAERAARSGTRTLILASSDLSHYLSPKKTVQLDEIALQEVLALKPEDLIRVVERENITMCGVLPTAALLFAGNALGVKQARLLKHCHSGDAAPMRKVVGYASVALEA
jgi:AmmeMemoRadiSam system protein B